MTLYILYYFNAAYILTTTISMQHNNVSNIIIPLLCKFHSSKRHHDCRSKPITGFVGEHRWFFESFPSNSSGYFNAARVARSTCCRQSKTVTRWFRDKQSLFSFDVCIKRGTNISWSNGCTSWCHTTCKRL